MPARSLERTVPLPRVPADLPAGAEVIIARPEFPTEHNPPGRRARVLSTHLCAPPERHGRPAPPPRLSVLVAVTDRPAYPGQQTRRWADELDLVEGGDA
jgi:hypothetical protein